MGKICEEKINDYCACFILVCLRTYRKLIFTADSDVATRSVIVLKRVVLFTVAMLLFSMNALADVDLAEEKVTSWKGSHIKLGLLINTGNTNTTDISAEIKLHYKDGYWTNTSVFAADFSRDSGETTAENYHVKDQLQYAFSQQRKSYIYGNVELTQDRFSAYEYQNMASVGYGRDIVKTKQWYLSMQAGPGVRYYQVDGSDESDTDLVFDTKANLAWHINKNLVFKQDVQYNVGFEGAYDYLESTTSLRDKLLGHLAMDLSYKVQYYSKIPPGSTNTESVDTITKLALIYSF